MEQITFENTAREMSQQLEATLARLALAAEAGLSTYSTEAKAQKLAGKLKAAAELFNGLPLWKDVEGSTVDQWGLVEKLPDSIFTPYAYLCKKCKEALPLKKAEDVYYAKIAKNLFVNLNDLPPAEIPAFKVKVEGNTLIAVRADLLAKLPSDTRKLLEGGEKEDE